jgi:peptidoglycan/LPS O-acetylase OafA/YrhL
MLSARTAHVLTETRPHAPTEPAAAAPPRLAFIDNVRWVMILLVISMHAAVTYSPVGSWYYREHPHLGPVSTLFFATYQGMLQGFFMALLFFVAGHFVPTSYEARGPRSFLTGRLYRLGAPTLLFVLTLGPLTEYLANLSVRAQPPLRALADYVTSGRLLSETGPLWFCVALLIFSAAYAALRAVHAPSQRRATTPTAVSVVLTVAALGAVTFAVRLAQPLGSSVLNLQLCYFPSYILLFTLGVVARRGDWLRRVSDRFAFTTAAVCVGLAMVMWLPLLILGGALQGEQAAFSGGLTWQSAGLSTWEALICVGMSFGVLAGFRRWVAGTSRVSRFMSDNAFAVYVIHAPILVALGLAMAPIALAPVAKFVVLWAAGALVSFGLAAPLARRIPWVGRILQ